MLLKKGITGFYSIGDSLPEINDYKTFRKVCFNIQNIIKQKLISTANPNNTSYFYAEFDNIYFLLNKYYAVAGFTKDISHGDKVFTDLCMSGIYLPEYEIIPAVTLNSSFNKTENNLSECELQQIKYYSPLSVGNIIFNEWD
ncbi:MAG: hypothetical protein NC177_13510 [Ruminococcus flavefaciens]|nr:hypothetical protein [Ruminococcus flavefaciens]